MKKGSALAVHVCLIYICLLTTATAETEIIATEKIKIKTDQTEDQKNVITWTYTFTVKDAKKGQQITINLSLPSSKDLIFSSTPAEVKRDDSSAGKWGLEVTADKSYEEIVITVTGSKNRFKDSQINLYIKVTDSAGKLIKKESVVEPGPAVVEDPAAPALVNSMIGVGISRFVDDSIGFKFTEKEVLIENDSLFRPVFLAGALFYVKPFLDKHWWLKPLGWCTDDILLSLAFANGTSQNSIDGFIFGLSKRVSNNLNFVVGYTLGRGTELSPGFQKSASQLIKKINRDIKKYPKYKRFKRFKPNGNRETQKLLDGLPLEDPTHEDKEKFFPGDPVISSFNSAIYIGFVFPIELKKMITPGGKK